ncbi:MAG TPA: hypothetical protein VEX65_08930 [Flavisolibacter sp.]|nr:hypothetical protein [Flavisolibacter sp.]
MHAATLIGRQDQLGTIEAGKLDDIVAVARHMPACRLK